VTARFCVTEVKHDEIVRWKRYYLPAYVSSCRTTAEKIPTITVHRGLNIAEKRGPL
jgi:hypothetical protein